MGTVGTYSRFWIVLYQGNRKACVPTVPYSCLLYSTYPPTLHTLDTRDTLPTSFLRYRPDYRWVWALLGTTAL